MNQKSDGPSVMSIVFGIALLALAVIYAGSLLLESGDTHQQAAKPTTAETTAPIPPQRTEAAGTATLPSVDPTAHVREIESQLPNHPMTEQEFNAMGADVERQVECGGSCAPPGSKDSNLIYGLPAEAWAKMNMPTDSH